ncbi:alpha/beta hydrolase [bacterium]|nr:alpha/beta hydrolase [bacterium]
MKKIILFTLIGLFALLLSGFLFEEISRNSANSISSEGQLADIGEHKLHYNKKGENEPTIVFETGFDPTGHLQWYQLQQSLSQYYTTISYDRAGILWSERGKNPKTLDNITDELHALLDTINASKPYILVGHSFGGMAVRKYAQKYPSEIRGVILIDSQCPTDSTYLSSELFTMVNEGLPVNFLKFANRFGLARLLFKNMFPKTEGYAYQNTRMPALLHKSAYAILEEQERMDQFKREAGEVRSIGSIPLYVISATDSERYAHIISDAKLEKELVEAWAKMQKDMLSLSSNSKQILVPHSGHYIHEDQPSAIVEVIKEMISETRR